MKNPFGFFASLTKGVGNKVIFYGFLLVVLIALGSAIFCSEERAQDIMNEGFYDPRIISLCVVVFVLAIWVINLVVSYKNWKARRVLAWSAADRVSKSQSYKLKRQLYEMAFRGLMVGATIEEVSYDIERFASSRDEAEAIVEECNKILKSYI